MIGTWSALLCSHCLPVQQSRNKSRRAFGFVSITETADQVPNLPSPSRSVAVRFGGLQAPQQRRGRAFRTIDLFHQSVITAARSPSVGARLELGLRPSVSELVAKPITWP